jgi:GTPase SAR1 family protein
MYGWKHLKKINLSNIKTLQSPPISVAETSEALLTYWSDLSRDSTHISRVRLLLTGIGAAGKTTLMQALTGDQTIHSTFLDNIQNSTRSTVYDWTVNDVRIWCQQRLFSSTLIDTLCSQYVDGSTLYIFYNNKKNNRIDTDLNKMLPDVKQRQQLLAELILLFEHTGYVSTCGGKQ